VLSSVLTHIHGSLLESLVSPALGLMRPTFPAMLSGDPFSHLFHNEITSRSLLSATLTLLTVCPAARATARSWCMCSCISHDERHGARVIVSASCPCSSTPLSSHQTPYLTPHKALYRIFLFISAISNFAERCQTRCHLLNPV
ncbi:hypothetical protein C8J57DRAFT_1339548, partial [Mycena rebaudengoi]